MIFCGPLNCNPASEVLWNQFQCPYSVGVVIRNSHAEKRGKMNGKLNSGRFQGAEIRGESDNLFSQRFSPADSRKTKCATHYVNGGESTNSYKISL